MTGASIRGNMLRRFSFRSEINSRRPGAPACASSPRRCSSPTLADQLRRLQAEFPQAKWHAYEPVTRDAVGAGCRLAFGEELEPAYHLDKADVIVALDADFLTWGPGRLKDSRAFAARRETEKNPRSYITGRAEEDTAPESATMNRLYAIECTPTLTGASADHRLPVAARDIAAIAQAIAEVLGVAESPATAVRTLPAGLQSHARWIEAMGRDLKAAGAKGLVIAGHGQPKEVHALTNRINHALGAVGQTVTFFERVDVGPTDHFGSIRELAADIRADAVDTLIILGGNPAYDAPSELDFANLLLSGKANQCIHLGPYDDETARLCHWHIPEAHALESWGDLRAFDGSATIQQPLIAPLYGGKSAIEVLALLLGEPGRWALRSCATTGGVRTFPAISKPCGGKRSREGSSPIRLGRRKP